MTPIIRHIHGKPRLSVLSSAASHEWQRRFLPRPHRFCWCNSLRSVILFLSRGQNVAFVRFKVDCIILPVRTTDHEQELGLVYGPRKAECVSVFSLLVLPMAGGAEGEVSYSVVVSASHHDRRSVSRAGDPRGEGQTMDSKHEWFLRTCQLQSTIYPDTHTAASTPRNSQQCIAWHCIA